MTRLIRTLTVVAGVLIALGGGTFVVLRASAHLGQATAGRLDITSTSVGRTDVSGTSPGTASSAGSVSTGPTGPKAGEQPKASPFPALAALTTKLEAAVAGTNSCLTVEDSAGRLVYQHQPDAPLIPASTQKLLVAEAALAILGPDYRFTTSVMATTAPVKGQVAGLWLVGGGDPLLATPEFIAATAGRARVAAYPWTSLARLADSVAAAGIKLVAGGIRGDDSFEDRLRFLPVWPPLYQQQNQIGLLSALSVNEGIQFTPPKSPLAQDPPNYAASELARLLQLRKVPVGSAPDQVAPTGAVTVASVTSAPLNQIVEAMLRASDNWIAELLVRSIDKAGGGTGTTAGGITAVMRSAGQAGVPLVGVQMDDGSGLSRTNRATCRELLAALDRASQAANSPVFDGLPVAGQSGTLVFRYRGTPVTGKLRAKTGSLDNAGGMVGVMTLATPVRFAFLDNDIETETALYSKEDAIVAALAAYPGSG